MKKYYFALLPILLLMSCGIEEHEPYQTSFVHIMLNENASTQINEKVNNINEYKVYLSSAPRTSNLEVYYEVVPGDGLKEGVDYQRVTTGNTLVFLPGIYDMPIRIKWMPHTIDATKNNTLTIRLTGSKPAITLGLPGPDRLQQQFVITKVK